MTRSARILMHGAV